MSCPSACGDPDIIANPQANCATSIRRKTLSRILFYPCNTVLPDPLPGNIKPLFDDGTIVASMTLANIVVEDPQTEDIVVDDCTAPRQFITTRAITFEDRNAITDTGSPANDYFDYSFWQNKNNIQQQLSYMFAYCDGDVVIPVDENGNNLTAALLVFLSWQKSSNPGGKSIEFKKGRIVFQGDPFNMSITPAFNLVTEGIIL